jgi:hypothetical protein
LGAHILLGMEKKLFSLIYSSCKHEVGSKFRNGFEPLRFSQAVCLYLPDPGLGGTGTCCGKWRLSQLWFTELALYAPYWFYFLAFAWAATLVPYLTNGENWKNTIGVLVEMFLEVPWKWVNILVKLLEQWQQHPEL